MPLLGERAGLRAGCSTGTNLYGVSRLACEMGQRGERGSIVSLLCDGADRYAGTYRSHAWVAERGWDRAGRPRCCGARGRGVWTDA